MPMTTEQLVAYLIESGTRSIEASDEFVPMLHIERNEHVVIMALATGGHPFDTLVQIAPSIIEQGPIDRLVMVSDSYMWKGGEDDYVEGPLQPRFEAGDPNVSECLMNVIVTANGTAEAVATQTLMPYTRTDDGVTWADAKDMADAVTSGRMSDLLSSIVRVSHMANEAQFGQGAPRRGRN